MLKKSFNFPSFIFYKDQKYEPCTMFKAMNETCTQQSQICSSPLGSPPRCSGPAGRGVLVSPGNRPLICGEALCGTRQPSKVLPIKAATRGGRFLHHPLCWQGERSLLALCPSRWQRCVQTSPVPSHRWITRQTTGW